MSEPKSEFQGEDVNAGLATPYMDLIAAAALVAISIWMMVESLRLPAPGGVVTAPGLLPFLSAGSLLLMAVVLGVSAWTRKAAMPASEVRVDLPPDFGRTLVLGAIVVIYVAALQLLPVNVAFTLGGVRLAIGAFEVASIVVLTGVLRIYWRQPLWACLAVALAWIAFLSIIFRTVFHIQLP